MRGHRGGRGRRRSGTLQGARRVCRELGPPSIPWREKWEAAANLFTFFQPQPSTARFFHAYCGLESNRVAGAMSDFRTSGALLPGSDVHRNYPGCNSALARADEQIRAARFGLRLYFACWCFSRHRRYARLPCYADSLPPCRRIFIVRGCRAADANEMPGRRGALQPTAGADAVAHAIFRPAAGRPADSSPLTFSDLAVDRPREQLAVGEVHIRLEMMTTSPR